MILKLQPARPRVRSVIQSKLPALLHSILTTAVLWAIAGVPNPADAQATNPQLSSTDTFSAAESLQLKPFHLRDSIGEPTSSLGLSDQSDLAAPIVIEAKTTNLELERISFPTNLARTKTSHFATTTPLSGPSPTALSSGTASSFSRSAASLTTTAITPQATEIAQTPVPEDVQQVKSRLQSLQETSNFGNVFQGSPAITILNPNGFGADHFTIYGTGSFLSKTRTTNKSDGAFGLGIGIGDSINAVGVELNYTFVSVGGNREFGTGAFNAKVHHQFPGDFSIAVGWNGFLRTGNTQFPPDFKDSIYGVVTKVFRVQDNIDEPFSRVAVTAGVGSGQFRTFSDFTNRVGTVGVFGSLAVRVVQPVSAILEWTGQDLSMGLSILPFRDFAFTITPAVRDITGTGTGARFVLGAGVAFQF